MTRLARIVGAGAVAIVALASAPGAVNAVPLNLDGEAIQGGLIVGKTAPDATVDLDGEQLAVSPEGDFLIGFGRDATGERTLMVVGGDGTMETRRLRIEERRYDIQRIEGLPDSRVSPSEEQMARIRAEKQSLEVAREVSTRAALFRSGFAWPADGEVSGVYGSQRILNGEARAPHFGLDIAAPKGTPVRAAADGQVMFVHPGMFFNGKTVVIDHGLYLHSIYVHLSEITVSSGETVRKGDPIGRIGDTGRASGAHLHWELRLGDTRLDPRLVLPEKSGPAPHQMSGANGNGRGGGAN